MSKTFCVLPFMSLATNASGNLRVCCNVIPSKGFIRKPNGQIYNISKDNKKETVKIPPTISDLVVFPSFVSHSVPKQLIDEERIVVAGNVDILCSKN